MTAPPPWRYLWTPGSPFAPKSTEAATETTPERLDGARFRWLTEDHADELDKLMRGEVR